MGVFFIQLSAFLCLALLSSCSPILYPLGSSSGDSTSSPSLTPTPTPANCVPGRAVFEAAGDWEFGGLEQAFVVPTACQSIEVKAWGAGGGGSGYGDPLTAGGAGGFVRTRISVTPGETLIIRVGHGGFSAAHQAVVCTSQPSYCDGIPRTWPFEIYGGGGKGAFRTSGNGGGASSVLRSQTELVVVGGGGGAGSYSELSGGAGGGDLAEGGLPLSLDSGQGYHGGRGGSLITYGGLGGGSSQAGSRGSGGNGGDPTNSEGDLFAGGGGGGGGYWGGGGGAGSRTGFHYGSGGGGGGCSYVSESALANERGSGRIPPQMSDSDYLPYVGTGGWDGHPVDRLGNGGDGLIVITW